jgi:hypothetical protein
MRPQAHKETQRLGPGAPVFVRLVVRLRDREPNLDKGWCSPTSASSMAHYLAAVTWNEASMTSRRPQPSDISVSLAGGAPRRNRTGDPILTMDRRPSAVLSAVSAGRPTPWVPQLWGHSTNEAVLVVLPHAGHELARKPSLSGSRGPSTRRMPMMRKTAKAQRYTPRS